MKRTLTLGLILAFLGASTAFGTYPATVKIDAAKKKQPAVLFNHAKHGDTLVKSCDTCHHTQKGLTKAQTNVVVKKCQECHLDPKSAKTPSMREMSLTKNPMHIACLNCHKTNKKGPTVCTGCHKKA